ncbi:negative regulator of systemic acquired resistance SNI1-like isoform X1 [Coffea arabica]|uniref:Negative regulator of systemic acquired resistance SNI1-like isoform X1 n=1 Tax=Coffea arabica TaxID=13443 RepID=A0A6P6VS39_COFAR|nr:negative regulator of systemic acquired resistance SNI1-like isoform X1 [Coffea arabica]
METRKRGRGLGANREGGRGNQNKYQKNESNFNRGRGGRVGLEENTLAILDTSSSASFHHLLDDRLAFLDAVRSASLVPENDNPPTKKMFVAVFQILKDESSLDLIIASYQLLFELNKRYPWVYLPKMEKSESSTPSKVHCGLIVAEEAWSPFGCNERDEATDTSGGSINPLAFHSLMQDIAKGATEERRNTIEIKSLQNMLLFQYLVNVLEGDLFPRIHAFKESLNWILLRECILNKILGSRKLSYKDLIKDCMSLIGDLSCDKTKITCDQKGKRTSLAELQKDCHGPLELALPEVEKNTCLALKKLLQMIMELDSSRNIADMTGLITRADGARIPAAEIILNELSYSSDLLFSFFLLFDEPEWKLKTIVQYFQKYIPKSSIRTRRSNGSSSDATFDGILKCFSNENSAKGIIKKMRPDVTQLLLAHGFQAFLSLSSKHSVEDASDSKQDVRGSSIMEICENVVSAFACFRKEDKQFTFSPFSREALFTAASVLSTGARS